MAKTEELIDLEEHALEHLADKPLLEEEIFLPEKIEVPVPVVRLAVAVSFSTLAAAIMVGGIFKGASPRFWAAVAGVLGVALAAFAYRILNPIAVNVAVVVGILVIGVILTIPAGALQDVVNLGPFVRDAVTSGEVLRPPVEFTLGWRAITGWLMGGLGFAAAWLAIQIRRPALGLISPLPVVAVGAISVPDDAKLASGLASLVLFAIGLGLLSGIEAGEGEQRSLAYELRRGARALPMIAAITIALFFLGQTNFLFPEPLFDPTQEAQRPRTVPLSEVPDRVLFTVEAFVTGPWRMGSLDVYQRSRQGRFEWLLPPFADNRLEEVARTGIVDSELNPGVRATFDIKDLGGAVLPGLPNLVGIVAEGPSLAYDSRTGNIRLAEGTVQAGLRYTVTAARIPTVEELQNVSAPPPKDIESFLEIPDPPPAVAGLLRQAPSDNRWNRLDFLRQHLLSTVASSGAGTPVAISPERVGEILTTTREATPFEIVAAQAMLARWAGVPARIGYGFDGGDRAGEVFEIRPRHGAAFLEVYFPGYKWLPIIGTPLLARSSISREETQQNLDVLPSDDIAVSVFVPFEVDPRTYLQQQIQQVMIVVVPAIVFLLAVYYTWPIASKAILRARRRAWAQRQGPRDKIAVAYAEWRDLATDFGYHHQSDTPLMFLDRVVEDEEHTELAWLVTRCLWGDLQDRVGPDDALAAEELYRSLSKRMRLAHNWTLRAIAAMSRLSLRYAYAPALGPSKRRRQPRYVPKPA